MFYSVKESLHALFPMESVFPRVLPWLPPAKLYDQRAKARASEDNSRWRSWDPPVPKA